MRDDKLIAEAAQRAQALAESGLPECQLIPQREDLRQNPGGALAHLRAIRAHADQCPTCLARTRYLESRFGPSRDPLFLRTFLAVDGLAQRGPLGPLLLGGAIAALFAGCAVLLAVSFTGTTGEALACVSTLIGALILTAGVYHSFSGECRRDWIRRIFARIVSGAVGAAYLDTLFRLWDHSSPLALMIGLPGPAGLVASYLLAGLAIAVAWPLVAQHAS